MSLGERARRRARETGRSGSGESDFAGAGSTIPAVVSERRLRAETVARAAGFLALAIFLALGVSGVLGERDAVVRAGGGGFELEVEYASVTRPGLDTPWTVTVTNKSGFDGPVTLRTTADYFALFDENGLDPEPDSIEQDEQWVTMEFARPSGDALVIDFDARVSPAVQGGATASTALMDGENALVEAEYTTKVMP